MTADPHVTVNLAAVCVHVATHISAVAVCKSNNGPCQALSVMYLCFFFLSFFVCLFLLFCLLLMIAIRHQHYMYTDTTAILGHFLTIKGFH